MLNVFKNTKPWMIASLLAASSVFAQQDRNCRTTKAPDPMPAPMTAAYNAPARIDVRSSWDILVDASFIYWQPLQDNMEYGIVSTSAVGSGALAGTNTVVDIDPSYEPGFKVGIGMLSDYDAWGSCLNYTWFHNTNTSTAAVPAGGSVYPMLGFPVAAINTSVGSATASWNLKMDLLDWKLSRPYYLGTKVTVAPTFGLRAAWIRQHYSQTYAGTTVVNQSSISWGVGPAVGVTTNYLFGYGLRMFGDMSTDVIYTHYSMNSQQTGGFAVAETGLGTVRPHTSLDVGFGWSTYFDNNNWHFDLLASYGFQVFWDQNMFRHFSNTTAMAGNSQVANGNLYVQGLTLTACFAF